MKVGLATLALSGLTVLIAACGGSGGGTSAAPSASGAPGGAGGFQAYAACLQRNGVTLPSGMARAGGRASRSPGDRPSDRPSGRPSDRPGGGGFGGFFGTEAPAGVDAATWEKAQQACQSVRPSGGAGFGGGNNSAFTAYRTCLSDHGVTLQNGAGQGLNTADPKVAAAVQACEPLRPTGRPGPTPSPSS
jgi:hypothetical protein